MPRSHNGISAPPVQSGAVSSPLHRRFVGDSLIPSPLAKYQIVRFWGAHLAGILPPKPGSTVINKTISQAGKNSFASSAMVSGLATPHLVT